MLIFYTVAVMNNCYRNSFLPEIKPPKVCLNPMHGNPFEPMVRTLINTWLVIFPIRMGFFSPLQKGSEIPDAKRCLAGALHSGCRILPRQLYCPGNPS